MKKRTLVCFLIFTLCVFYTAIPNTVFGQEEDASLAEQVLENYSELLQREDIQAVLPQVLEGLKAPNIQALLTPAAISAVVTTPSLLTTFVPTIDPQFVTLLEEDAELRAMLSDPLVQSLLTDVDAIEELEDELETLLAAEPEEGTTPPDEEVTPPTDEVTPPPVQEEVSLAEQVLAKHSLMLQRADIQAVLPDVLEGLKAPNIQALLTPAAISAVVATPSLLTTFVPTIDPQFVTLLEEDAELRAMLSDPLVQSLLTDVDAIEELEDELETLLAAGPTEPEVTEPEVTEPEVTEPEVTEPEVTEPEVTEPEVTEPEVTEPEVTEPEVVVPPPTEGPDLIGPPMPADESILGDSRLGGLSLNPIAMRDFTKSLIARVPGGGSSDNAEATLDLLLSLVPQGFLSSSNRDIIKGALWAERVTPFRGEAGQLDDQNFGNAITPNFADLVYVDDDGKPTLSPKYLTRDSLQVYTRVPKKVDGVTFSLRALGVPDMVIKAQEITGEFGADTIPYTFRLDETLAAANLPAWPDLDNQLFSDVRLRWSYELTADFSSIKMDDMDGDGVWEVEVGIPPGGNVYYYFEVDLMETLAFKTLDYNAISYMDPETFTLEEVINATKVYEIDGWAMPDPRNFQLENRGLFEALYRDIDDEVNNLLRGQADIGKALSRIQQKLLDNAYALADRFETEYDPLVASVFSVPKVDLETQSLWFAPIPDIANNEYVFTADVIDDGISIDRIEERIIVDTSAPAAGIDISADNDENVTGYWNDDEVFVATAKSGSGTLDITGMPDLSEVGRGEGYLFYQMIGLDGDGNPDLNIVPNTWMPLTAKTMLASNIWDAIQRAVTDGRIDIGDLSSNPLVQAALALPLDGLLGFLDPTLIQGTVNNNPELKQLAALIGPIQLNEAQALFIAKALKASVALINKLVPVTYAGNHTLTIPITVPTDGMDVKNYGIRAMGIDTLFNVGSYAAPTRLRIVAPVYDKARVTAATIADQYRVGEDGYEIGTIYANTTEGVKLTGTIDLTGHPVTSVLVQYEVATDTWVNIGPATVMDDGTFEISWNVSDFDALLAAGATVNVQAIATNKLLQLPDPDPMVFSINLDAGIYPPEVLDIVVDSIEKTNPDSGGPQGMVIIKAYTLSQTGPETVKVRFELTQSDGTTIPFDPVENGVPPTDIADTVQAALASAIGGTNASVNPDDYHEWTLTIDTTELADTITKDSPGARDASKDDNQYTIRAFAVSMDEMEWPSDKTEMLSVDNIDDVGPLGPTNITTIANVGGMFDVETDTHRGLVDENDPSVVPQSVTLTIEPTAKRKTYSSVMLVSDPEINAALIRDITETPEGSGVFTVTVDIGALGIEGNGAYKLEALVDDEPQNGQVGESPERTVHVKNYLRPDPAVFKIAVDVGTEKNADSEGPQGTFMFTGYTIEQNSPPITSIRLEAKRAGDTDWTIIGTDDASTSIEIEDAALPGVLDHLTSIAVEGTEVGNRSVVAIDATYHEWAVSVDTIALGLADSITNTSPGARDVSLDDNPYTVRAFAVDGSGKEWASDATEMFSLDNVDDVAPLGPTNVSVTSVEATDNMVFEDAGDGSYTVGGLVDKYDDAVNSPVVTFTVEPTAVRKTYASVRFVPGVEGLVITDVIETAEGSGVFTVTVDVGTLADGETYLEDGTYMFHALAFDKFGNEQDDISEISVTVENSYRPAPEVLALAVDPESVTQTNPDSGAPQGTITLHAYSHEVSSPPTTSVKFEVKRKNDPDTAWKSVGIDTEGTETTEVSDATFADFIGDLANTAVSAAEASDGGNATVVPISRTYQMWAIDVDTTALEDTIMKDSRAARDASKDDNRYMVRAVPIEEASDFEDPGPSPGATAMFSVDNDDDVAPLGPTNVSVTNVEATGSVFEDAGDGSYTVGGLVDKYDEAVNDEAVNSPVATFTVEPTAHPDTYESIRFVPGVEGLVITDVKPAEDGAFTVTVDVGTLADGEYLENGIYMFHALAFDEFGNVQADDSETDGSRISVTVANTYRPAPQVLAFTVGDPTQTNPDSGAPQGTISLYGYSPEITSAPTTSVVFEVKRKNDTEWKAVGTASESSPVTAADDAKLAAADVADVAGENVVTSDTYQKWMIEVDTTTLEDSITADSPGARDHTKDDNQYMVRATAMAKVDGSANLSVDGVTEMFSVDNVDDVAPIGPTNVSVTSVDAIDSVLEAAEDGSYTVGGLVDKYDEAVLSPVATFTLKPTADRKAYKSVRFVTDIENLVVTEVTETAEGSGVFTVTVDVGTLADMKTYLENGTYMFHALAFDEFANEQADDSETDGSKISVTVENSYRPAPEVLAIAVDPESITQTNPDSGAPQGTITLHSYSHEISSPPTTAVRFEVKRPSDAEWIDVEETATKSSATEISDATLTDVVDDLAHVAVSATEAAEGAEGTVVPISRNQMWTIEVDTTTLEDTITAESPAARDASKDDNQYMVRAVAIAAADQSETLSADGVTAMFSVDNVDDVSPLGPTNIVAVADVAGPIAANEDGSYTVGGIVDDTVPSPIATFTTEPTADPITYASVNLVQTADGTETITEGEAGVLDITIDVGLLENGTYMFHALAVDEFGNVQTDESPMITVHVLNFRVSDVTDLAVIAVDGTDVPEPPAEPIPLRESVTVSFIVANDSLAVEELSGAVDGSTVPSERAEDPENTFSLMVEVGALVDGVYTPDGVVTKRNGSVAFPLTTVNVDNTGPMVTIESPTEDETVDSLPTLRATYHDGAGSGVDGATGSLALARLQPNEVEVVVDQAELEKDAASLVYTRREELAGGAYRVTVQVTDNLGNVGEGSAEFAVNGTAPMVAIHSPAAGQTFEHGEPLISGEFSGTGTVEVTTFTINDVDATPEVDGNQFSYTPEEALVNGDYKVVVAVTDGDGNTARTSVVFMVDIPEPPKDTTPPVISSVAPTGLIKGADREALGSTRASAVVTDEQSAISAVEFSINGQLIRVSRLNIAEGIIEAPIDFVTHGPGLYTVRLKATSEGGTTEHVWTFTFAIDDVKPTITSITPSGTFRGGLPVISASASDESGIDKMTITVMDSKGKEVKGKTGDDGEDTAKGISRLDFNPDAPLEEGTYTIAVRATDTLGNSATAKGNFTIDFDTAAPIITMASPQNNARLMYAKGEARRPTISISYADAETGINVESIRFIFNDKLTNLTPEQKSASQVTYIPPEDLDPGQYSVKLEVFDRANEEGNVSDKSKGAREANMAVYEFTFSVEEKDGPILAARPLNYPNPFKDKTRISFTLARQATVSIVIYDATLRPVRVLVDNRVFDAGNYTRKDNGSDAIGWDGTSSSGEDLARGIYFCEIIVADGFEPEYAILKLALTR